MPIAEVSHARRSFVTACADGAVRKVDPDLVERTIHCAHAGPGGHPNSKTGVFAINLNAGENGLLDQGEEAEKMEPG